MTHTPMTQARNDLLDWENLSEVPAGRALRRSLAELLVRPGRFFGKMAISGGLFEPLAFFAVVLGAAILLAFPAALAYVRLAAPDPERVGAAAYSAGSASTPHACNAPNTGATLPRSGSRCRAGRP